MIRHLAYQAEAAEPAVGRIQVHLLAQAPFRANAIAVTHNQHAEHDLGIDRGTAGMAIEGGKVVAEFAQIEQGINLAQ